MSESSSDGNGPHSSTYISVLKAVQLIPKSFTGNPVEMREFIQIVEAAYEVVEPLNYSVLFKFVCPKIGGEAKAKILARTHVNNWEQAKAVLEKNYRTLHYYAHKAFNGKQIPTETVSQWGARIDKCVEICRKQPENTWRISRGPTKNARVAVTLLIY